MKTNINNNVEQQFLKTIDKYNMINNGDTVIVGLSGGCDSSSLLTLLQKYQSHFNINIMAVHINHYTREDSNDDENFCINLCKQKNIPLDVYHIDVVELAKKQKRTVEEAGRDVRYATFSTYVKDSTYKIAIAHNKNDVAETFLMRLFRGSGTNGLKSIPPTRDNIIRPIIEIERPALIDYLNSLNQEYYTDTTNFKPIYTRNKIRLNVLPYIRDTFNEKIVSTLYDTAKILEEENDFIASVTNTTFEKVAIINNTDNTITINIQEFSSEHPYLQKQILLKSTSYFIENNQNINKKHISAILNILQNKSDGSRSLSLPQGLQVSKNYNELKFYKQSNNTQKSSETPELTEQPLQFDHIMYIPSIDKYLFATVLNNDEYTRVQENSLNLLDIVAKDNMTKDLKLNIVKVQFFCYYNVYEYLHIKVRNRRNGDKINIKNVGTKKLKDYFIDKKVPVDLRDSTPLIALGSDILWILDDFNTVHNNYIPNTNDKLVIMLMEA